MGLLSKAALNKEEWWRCLQAALSGRFRGRTGFRVVRANAASLSTQRCRLFHALGQILQVIT